jgi:Uma2 family endonuclease
MDERWALQLDDFNNQDLRDVADRLLETTRVEYVDEGALLIMNPPGIEHRRSSAASSRLSYALTMPARSL